MGYGGLCCFGGGGGGGEYVIWMFERAIVDAAGVFEGEDCECGYAEYDEQIQAIGGTGRFEGRERYHGRRVMEKVLG